MNFLDNSIYILRTGCDGLPYFISKPNFHGFLRWNISGKAYQESRRYNATLWPASQCIISSSFSCTPVHPWSVSVEVARSICSRKLELVHTNKCNILLVQWAAPTQSIERKAGGRRTTFSRMTQMIIAFLRRTSCSFDQQFCQKDIVQTTGREKRGSRVIEVDEYFCRAAPTTTWTFWPWRGRLKAASPY